MNSRRLRIGAATAISVVATSLAATTTPAAHAADCFTVDPAPSITGLVRVGDDLTAHRGTWTPTPSSLVVTWYIDGTVVEGNDGDGGEPYHGLTYSPETSDAGKQFTIKVTGTRAGCSPAQTVASAPTIPVHPADYNTGQVANPGTPSLGGDFTVGKTVTASPGTWPAGTQYHQYRWFVVTPSGLGLLASTSGPSLRLPGDTYGRQIAVKVAATLDYSALTLSPASDSSPTVAIGTLTGTRPTISGVRKVGRRLTAVRGTWTSGTTFSYRWFANGRAITGATARTFTPKPGQAGKRLSVRVTGRQTGYRTLALTSASTRPVAR
jgi:hypothetical protein